MSYLLNETIAALGFKSFYDTASLVSKDGWALVAQYFVVSQVSVTYPQSLLMPCNASPSCSVYAKFITTYTALT